jgi:hypothetical protein
MKPWHLNLNWDGMGLGGTAALIWYYNTILQDVYSRLVTTYYLRSLQYIHKSLAKKRNN